MANYKTADKLPILEEVTENTYALVEDGGALKRVAGSVLGGSGAGQICTFTHSMIELGGASSFTCNMTHNELLEAINNRTLGGLNIICYYDFFAGVGIVQEVRIEDSIIKIYFNYPNYNNYMIYYNPDNTINTID